MDEQKRRLVSARRNTTDDRPLEPGGAVVKLSAPYLVLPPPVGGERARKGASWGGREKERKQMLKQSGFSTTLPPPNWQEWRTTLVIARTSRRNRSMICFFLRPFSFPFEIFVVIASLLLSSTRFRWQFHGNLITRTHTHTHTHGVIVVYLQRWERNRRCQWKKTRNPFRRPPKVPFHRC